MAQRTKGLAVGEWPKHVAALALGIALGCAALAFKKLRRARAISNGVEAPETRLGLPEIAAMLLLDWLCEKLLRVTGCARDATEAMILTVGIAGLATIWMTIGASLASRPVAIPPGSSGGSDSDPRC